ncbi:MAG: DUF4383 domain-containing protein [Actinomycetota bacterium]|nr:DUF4383 domain-containing protein [Actinomycetota bacterium]
MERIAHPRLYSTLVGLLLVLAGLFGFLVSSEFRHPELTSDLLGFYPVNGWVNSFHLVAGLVGLALARPLPRLFALLAGVGFTALGVWGVLAPNGELLFGSLPATRTVNLINLGIGLLGLAALLASRWDRIAAAFATWFGRLGRRRERTARRRREKELRKRRRAAATSSGANAGGNRPGSKRP